MNAMAFKFLDLDHLTDGVIDLLIEEKQPASPSRDYFPAYYYNITLHNSKEIVGGIRLRVGPATSLLAPEGHIGYGIEPRYRGHHLAARACQLVGRVARAHGMDRLLITCDPENIASRKTCERIGARLVGIVDVPADHELYRKGARRVCRYEWVLGQSTSPNR
jgi:tagatose 1,6-diphosphate aldolase